MNDTARLLEEGMKKLAERFIADAQGRIERVRALLGPLDRGTRPPPAELEEGLRAVHGLVGAGGTMGFPQLSGLALPLEVLLKRSVMLERDFDPAEQAQFGRLMARLTEMVARLDVSRRVPIKAGQAGADPELPTAIAVMGGDAAGATALSEQLAGLGYRPRIASDLDTALGAADAQARAAVVDCDAGASALAAIKGLAARLPVLAVGADGRFGARLAAMRAGARGFLAKPVGAAALAEGLETLLAPPEAGPFRVLVVDDHAALAECIAAMLRGAGMASDIIGEPADLPGAIAALTPDVVLLSAALAGGQGLDLARVVRQDPARASLPVLFMVEAGADPRQLAAIAAEGDDSVARPLEPATLAALITARAVRARRLARFLVNDGLTGLLNHVAVKERLGQDLARAAREGKPLAVAMLDLDRFKAVNDRHGHLAGDGVLRSLARLLRRRLRRSDSVGRWGGEEFLVVLPDTPPEQAARLIDGLRGDFAKLRHEDGRGETFGCSYSAGVAAYPAAPGAEALIAAADRALYAAKEAGRDRVALA
ncbi:MAG: diguanylate cyclase [Alphaproteobacteria bacterium]|nr:diguanylate cyclase [Alphaproteobacteria bacterium]